MKEDDWDASTNSLSSKRKTTSKEKLADKKKSKSGGDKSHGFLIQLVVGKDGIGFDRIEFRWEFLCLESLHHLYASFYPLTDGEEDGEARMTRDLADEMLTLLIVILSERFVVGIGQVSPRAFGYW